MHISTLCNGLVMPTVYEHCELAVSGVAIYGMTDTANRTVFRTCPLCEATCGLEISVNPQEQIVRIRGDQKDVFSHGFICPKGSTLKQLHEVLLKWSFQPGSVKPKGATARGRTRTVTKTGRAGARTERPKR